MPQHLDTIAGTTISFDDLPDAFQDFIDGKVVGRIVVEVSS